MAAVKCDVGVRGHPCYAEYELANGIEIAVSRNDCSPLSNQQQHMTGDACGERGVEAWRMPRVARRGPA